MSTVHLPGLEASFDNDSAERVLNLSVSKAVHTSDLIRKSMYDFDLDSPEGIQKLLSLLPIMDPDILKDIISEIWPGYPSDVDGRRHRMEIKGYFQDFLQNYDEQSAQTEEAGSEEDVDPGPDAGGAPQEEATTKQAPAPTVP